MWKLRPLFSLFFLLLLLLCSSAAFARNSARKWQTLSGDAPLVIANGGFSGIFPGSSYNAYEFGLSVGLPNLISWCDVQLSKDGAGICFPSLQLEKASDVAKVFNARHPSTYLVNGVSTKGYFPIDFTLKDIGLLTLSQGIYSRPYVFDGMEAILTVQDVASKVRPPAFWLNVQHDAFFTQHNLSMRRFVISVSKSVVVNYISSPEVNFLRGIVPRFKPSPTKLIFRFLGLNDIEPSTNQSYSSLLKNLTFIKTFASGILVPKSYIWPLDSLQYLQQNTSVVSDAHNQGLEVFAADFTNDIPYAYDYNYDPVTEFLTYIDNGNFSVDGVLSDFPITPSATVDCFSHLGKNETEQVNFSIITSEGSSGQYPGCTDRAYEQAIVDGADIIDCPVQMSADGFPFCLGSINLIPRTTAAQSPFINVTLTVLDLGIQNGIFAFNLTWGQIQTLHPLMYSPYADGYKLYRNPKFINAGKFVLLSEFLAIAKNANSISGVLISIENAAFLAQNVGLDVVGAVVDALNQSGYYNQTGKKVLIQSRDSAVLTKLGKSSNYELVYNVDDSVSDVDNSTILEIKSFASSVLISKNSVYPDDQAFLLGVTQVVPKFRAFGVPVYVQLFSNEFVSQAYDFFCDPYVEINTYISEQGVDGVVTGFPATSARFRINRCLGYKQPPPYMLPVQPGGLFPLMDPSFMPPAEAPYPVLNESNVIEAPLPPVVGRTPLPSVVGRTPPTGTGNATTAPAPTNTNGQNTIVANSELSILAILVTLLFSCQSI